MPITRSRPRRNGVGKQARKSSSISSRLAARGTGAIRLYMPGSSGSGLARRNERRYTTYLAPNSTAIYGKAEMPRKYEGVIWRKYEGKRVPYARVYWTDSAGRKRRTERQARTVSEARQFRLDMLREL